jgi:hypothetical protein
MVVFGRIINNLSIRLFLRLCETHCADFPERLKCWYGRKESWAVDTADKTKYYFHSPSLRPRGLRRGSASARLLGLWVLIPPEAWMSLFNKRCVLSYRGHCVGLIIRPEESYWVWCVWAWSWSLDNVEALHYWGLLRPREGEYANKFQSTYCA